jgi:hypothetical protein
MDSAGERLFSLIALHSLEVIKKEREFGLHKHQGFSVH